MYRVIKLIQGGRCLTNKACKVLSYKNSKAKKTVLKTRELKNLAASILMNKRSRQSRSNIIVKSADIAVNSLSSSLIVADLEHMLGTKIIFSIRLAKYLKRNDTDYALYTILRSRCPRFEKEFDSSFDVAYGCFRHFVFSKDLDLLLDYMKAVFDFTHFPQTEYLFRTFSKFFMVLWNLATARYGALGLYVELSGKLSRHLLTKARTTKLRLGKTSAAERRINVAYRYRQTTSETGAYGISIWYYTESKIYRKEKKIE